MQANISPIQQQSDLLAQKDFGKGTQHLNNQ